MQGFPHYPRLLDSSFLRSHWLLNLPGCYFPSSRSPACDKELAFLWHVAFDPVCSFRRSPARYGICITEQKGKNTPLLSLMCSIGKHPNSYSFSRKALPGFLAYCVRDLVFLGSTFPTETCQRHQEPLAVGTCGCFCFAATGPVSSCQPTGPAWAGNRALGNPSGQPICQVCLQGT